MEIDRHAPAVAGSEIAVAASPDVVWGILTDVASWPSWSPAVKSASIEGPVAPGTRFRWKVGLGTILSTLETVEPPHRLVWTGKTAGIRAIHVHTLEQKEGTTVVRSEESWDGLLVRLLRRPLAKSLEKSLDSGLRALKVEAERRASSAPAP